MMVNARNIILAIICIVHRNARALVREMASPQQLASARESGTSRFSTTNIANARAFFMFKNEPIPAFRHKTLLQLVQDGRVDDAIDYLESISSGFAG